MDLEGLCAAFKKTINNSFVKHIVLKNNKNTQVGICNYGARITHFITPDKAANLTDIVLGFNTIEDYLHADELYHGVTVGPFANRIAKGAFTLNQQEYQLEINNGANNLHSGSTGFHNKVWEITNHTENAVSLTVSTPEFEGGFPGLLTVTVTYSLNDDNELSIVYKADTKKDTVINLTNHAYFNLNGEGNGNILNHQVKINSDKFVAIDEQSIPTGELKNVEHTAFDFRDFKAIGKNINQNDEQLICGQGYDHSFELNQNNSNDMTFAAAATGDITGITLEVYTTEPAVQFYSGNFLNGNDKGKGGINYQRRTGFCFETQHHPDSPNQPDFSNTVLKTGESFYSKTIYKVSK